MNLKIKKMKVSINKRRIQVYDKDDLAQCSLPLAQLIVSTHPRSDKGIVLSYTPTIQDTEEGYTIYSDQVSTLSINGTESSWQGTRSELMQKLLSLIDEFENAARKIKYDASGDPSSIEETIGGVTRTQTLTRDADGNVSEISAYQ